nr:hypothetical protein [Arthrobacter sp. 9AX]
MGVHAAVPAGLHTRIRVLVACVGESPACPFYALDRGVVGFYFGRCRARNDEDFDFFPPPANGVPEPVRFRLGGFLDQSLQQVVALAASARDTVASSDRSCSFTSQAACSVPVASSVANTVASVSPARRSSRRLAQTRSIGRTTGRGLAL